MTKLWDFETPIMIVIILFYEVLFIIFCIKISDPHIFSPNHGKILVEIRLKEQKEVQHSTFDTFEGYFMN